MKRSVNSLNKTVNHSRIVKRHGEVVPFSPVTLSKKQRVSKPCLSPKFISKSSMSVTNTRPQNFGCSGGSKILSNDLNNKEAATTIPPMSPVVFLRAHLAKLDKENNISTPASHSSFFTKPSHEDMAAYDTDVVNTIRARDIERLRSYHNEGRSLNACNRFGESLLHMACRRGDADVVSFLVNEARVKVNVRDDYGRTPFHDACWTSTPNFDVMDVLIKVADPHLLLSEDVRGHTPFDYARREHWDAWVNFLRQRTQLLCDNTQVAMKVVG